MNAVLKTAAGNPENQDRGAIIEYGNRLVLVVADGAGGLSGGAEAATMAVEIVRERAEVLTDSRVCADVLQEMDRLIAKSLAGGESTCVIAVVTEASVCGASVGDSGAWLINDSGFTDLTKGQSRKPLLGSGSAWAFPFEFKRSGQIRLLLATDGLLKYTSPERIQAVCRSGEPDEFARRLIELVRYPSGALPDDVTVILVAGPGATPNPSQPT